MRKRDLPIIISHAWSSVVYGAWTLRLASPARFVSRKVERPTLVQDNYFHHSVPSGFSSGPSAFRLRNPSFVRRGRGGRASTPPNLPLQRGGIFMGRARGGLSPVANVLGSLMLLNRPRLHSAGGPVIVHKVMTHEEGVPDYPGQQWIRIQTVHQVRKSRLDDFRLFDFQTPHSTVTLFARFLG